jgi:sugar phosphate permease
VATARFDLDRDLRFTEGWLALTDRRLLGDTPASADGSAVGIMFSTQAIGAAIAPLLAGWVADTWGLLAVFYFLACTIVLANFFVFLMPRDLFERRGGTTA